MKIQDPVQRKNILACVLGNIFEWYDFALFGAFATILSKLFSPLKMQ